MCNGERGRLACCVWRLAEHSLRCTRLFPVGETPTVAAETAALPIQRTAVHGEPPFALRMHWDYEPTRSSSSSPSFSSESFGVEDEDEDEDETEDEGALGRVSVHGESRLRA